MNYHTAFFASIALGILGCSKAPKNDAYLIAAAVKRYDTDVNSFSCAYCGKALAQVAPDRLLVYVTYPEGNQVHFVAHKACFDKTVPSDIARMHIMSPQLKRALESSELAQGVITKKKE